MPKRAVSGCEIGFQLTYFGCKHPFFRYGTCIQGEESDSLMVLDYECNHMYVYIHVEHGIFCILLQSETLHQQRE